MTVVDLNAVSGLYPNADAHVPYFSNGERDRLHPSNEGHRRLADALARPRPHRYELKVL